MERVLANAAKILITKLKNFLYKITVDKVNLMGHVICCVPPDNSAQHYLLNIIIDSYSMNALRHLSAVAVLLAGSILPMSGSNHEKTLGIMGGYSTYNQGGFMNLFFQYGFTENIRIAPEVGFAFRSEDKSAFLLSADMQFPFRIYRGIQVYPLVGLTFNNWNYSHSSNSSHIGADVGMGFDFRITDNLKLNVQGKYSAMKHTDGVFVGAGIGYVF